MSTFEDRKRDHIRIALDPRTQATGQGGFEQIELINEALPEIDFDEVSLQTSSLGLNFNSPIFVSSMTAGHEDSFEINLRLAKACEARGWLMGVGSQRKELTEASASKEWLRIRELCPKVQLAGNIGLSQVITTSTQAIEKLCSSLGASALFVHTNPLQEALQPEGTPQFKGGIAALERLCRELSLPVILKEVGCGFSESTLRKLVGKGLAAVDLSGKGGTHWGRVEGYRTEATSSYYKAAEVFANWGVPTVDALVAVHGADLDYELWASGGVRSGLDAAKLIALGANMVGAAKPFLEGAMAGPEILQKQMDQFDLELKIALFSTGSLNPKALQEKQQWRQIKI